MKDVDCCCGFVGIYNIVYLELLMEFLDYKMDCVYEIEVVIIVIVNLGCLL